MQRKMLERKCDVCGRRAQMDAASIGNLTFRGWWTLQTLDMCGLHDADVCGRECLVKFAAEAKEGSTT